MAVITRSNFGAIAINNKVLEKMIIEDLLKMSNSIVMCNKKGKIIKEKPTPIIDPDYYDSVEVNETTKDGLYVNIYLISYPGTNISEVSNEIFDKIEANFEVLSIRKPDLIKIAYKGLLSNELHKRNTEVTRRNGD